MRWGLQTKRTIKELRFTMVCGLRNIHNNSVEKHTLLLKMQNKYSCTGIQHLPDLLRIIVFNIK